MRKAEFEAHLQEYTALEDSIATLLDRRNFQALFANCVASFPHIVPAIKWRTANGIEPQTPPLLALETIFRYAPPLFEHGVIESLLKFLRSTRILAKHDNRYVHTAEAALDREEVARHAWTLLEQEPGRLQRDLVQELKAQRGIFELIIEVWEQLGIVVRQPTHDGHRLCLTSLSSAIMDGVCPSCGVRGKGRRELFFRSMQCKKCGTQGYYYLDYASRRENLT